MLLNIYKKNYIFVLTYTWLFVWCITVNSTAICTMAVLLLELNIHFPFVGPWAGGEVVVGGAAVVGTEVVLAVVLVEVVEVVVEEGVVSGEVVVEDVVVSRGVVDSVGLRVVWDFDAWVLHSTIFGPPAKNINEF